MRHSLATFVHWVKVKKLCERLLETSSLWAWQYSPLPWLFNLVETTRTKLPQLFPPRSRTFLLEGHPLHLVDRRFLLFAGGLILYILIHHFWRLIPNNGLDWGPYVARPNVSGFQTFVNTVVLYSKGFIPAIGLYIILNKGRDFLEGIKEEPRLYVVIGAFFFIGFELTETLPFYIVQTNDFYKHFVIKPLVMISTATVLTALSHGLTYVRNHRERSHAARIKGLTQLKGDHNKEIYQEAERWEQLV